MPHTTTWEKQGVFWHLYGIVTALEVEEANSELYDDPRFDSLKYLIWDVSDVDLLDLTEKNLASSAASDKVSSTYVPLLKLALVAKEGRNWEFCRYYIDMSKRLGSTWEFELFENIEDARAWVSS